MRRLMLTSAILMLVCGMVCGYPMGPGEPDTLRISMPREGEQLRLESSVRVRWDNAGSGNVKLELLQNGVIKGLIYSGYNVGNWRWFIKNYLNGSPILPGDYKLRITLHSDPGNCDEVNLTILPRSEYVDFIVSDLSMNNNRKLMARVRNRGYRHYNGDLKFRIFENESQKGDETLSVNIRPYAVSRELVFRHTVEWSRCGTFIQLVADPDNAVVELNENNNSLLKRVFFETFYVRLLTYLKIGKAGRHKSVIFGERIPTVVITPEMAIRITKKRPGGIWASVDYLAVTVPITFYFRNCGSATRLRDIWINIEKAWPDTYPILSYRRAHTIESGERYPLYLTPTLNFVPANNRMRIDVTGGYRSDTGDLEFTRTGGAFMINLRFEGFESYYFK